MLEITENRGDNGEISGRDANGRFVAGNPGGGRRPLPAEIREMLENATPRATAVLCEIIDDPEQNTSDRLRAITILFERLFGKAPALFNAIALNFPGSEPKPRMLTPEELEERYKMVVDEVDEID